MQVCEECMQIDPEYYNKWDSDFRLCKQCFNDPDLDEDYNKSEFKEVSNLS